MFEFVPPPPSASHGVRGGPGLSSLILSHPRSLGTGTIRHAGPASHPTLVHQTPTAPQAAHQEAIFRPIDEHIDPVSAPPNIVQSHNVDRVRSSTARQSAVAMPPIPESPASLAPPNAAITSPSGDHSPVTHQRGPGRLQTRGLSSSMPMRGAGKGDGDDGLTPVAPAPSNTYPNSPRGWLPSSPRDALGIPISKVFFGPQVWA
ncbi:hypothetical protein PG985_000989 [Apiospora marii]|uniref:uncharacterized protein n=1 Tax=Apiospora marii TaxID=335849 RepID=UPI00312D26E5